MQKTETQPKPNQSDSKHARADTEPVFLGQGAQFKVYDLGNGRVKKVPQDQEGSEQAISIWYKGAPSEIPEYARNMQLLRDRGNEHVAKVIRNVPDAASFFGNPIFEPDGSVIQDKVALLGEQIDKSSPEGAKELLRKYIGSIKKSWDYGCYDWVFNLCTNTGVDQNGEVVMMDFGEMGLDKDTALDLVNNRPWENSYDTTHRLSQENRDYFVRKASEDITPDSLDRHWQSALPETAAA